MHFCQRYNELTYIVVTRCGSGGGGGGGGGARIACPPKIGKKNDFLA